LDPSWRVVVLDDDESKLFFHQRLHLIRYRDEFFERGPVFEEWDDGEPADHDCFLACSFPCYNNKDDIEWIKDEIDPERLGTFNSETKFIQRLLSTYNSAHLILINEELFSSLLNIRRPAILAHETFHIVEYELNDQTHKGENINEIADVIVEEYINSLTHDERKHEFNKISSHRNGRGIYGRLRLITKYK
jgi:hypothetical protein